MIKPASFAGAFYPNNKVELSTMISSLLKNKEAKNPIGTKLRALIVPHAGYVYSADIAASGYVLLKNEKFNNIIIIGPSHNEYFEGMVYGNFDSWETPLGIINSDNSKVNVLDDVKEFNLALSREHSVEVQLPFIQTLSPESTVTPLITGYIDSFGKYSERLSKVLEDSLLIISSDLSHYHPYENAQKIDKTTIDEILKLNKINHDQACGADGINILTGIVKRHGWKPVLLDYRNSGDTQGDKDSVVGYCSIAFFE